MTGARANGSAKPALDKAALTRTRAALAQARGKQRLDIIMDVPDPGALVRALPIEEIYFTIRDIGFGDAIELVQLASPEQFRGLLDLDCWDKDTLDPRKVLPWIRAARVGSLRDDKMEARWRKKLAALDAELLSLLLRNTLKIHDLEEDEDPNIESEHFMRSPKGQFLVEFLVEGTEYLAIKGLLDDLYAEDPFKAARLLTTVRWELESELNEISLRWRTGRLADMGFPSLEEALSYFAKPASAGKKAAAPGLGSRPLGFFIQTLGRGTLLDRATAKLDGPDAENVERQMATAANAVLVADAIDPGDLEKVKHAFEAARAYLNFGLESLSKSDELKAVEVLAATSLKRIFQEGFGRVLALKWRAERVFKSGKAGTREMPSFESPLGEMLSALARKRPLYYPGVERPREEWGTPEAGVFEPRHFLTAIELQHTNDAMTECERRVGASQSV